MSNPWDVFSDVTGPTSVVSTLEPLSNFPLIYDQYFSSHLFSNYTEHPNKLKHIGQITFIIPLLNGFYVFLGAELKIGPEKKDGYQAEFVCVYTLIISPNFSSLTVVFNCISWHLLCLDPGIYT